MNTGGAPRLVFFGNERLATGITETKAPVLRSLLAQGYDIAAIVVSQKVSSSRRKRPLEVEAIAAEHNIPLLAPDHPRDLLSQLQEIDARAGVLAAYGRIVPPDLIEAFPRGIINLHPSLLPRYRGPIPIEQAILDGAKETGVSIMSLAPKMDAGPVYAQRQLALRGDEQKVELAKRLSLLGAQTLLEVLPAILEGKLKPQPQDDAKVTFCNLLRAEDRELDWSRPAVELERRVRALAGWPGTRATLFGRDVVVTAAHVSAHDTEASPGESVRLPDGTLAIGTGAGLLVIDRLKPAGRGEMDARAFLAGLR